jgi:rhodanese-related sulfurtransferase
LQSLESRPDLTVKTERLGAPFAAEVLASSAAPLLLDIRNPREREQKHLAKSTAIPLNHLSERLEQLPRDRPVLVYCAGGYRSSIAASLLQRYGFPDVSEIAGGIAAWEAAKLPVQAAQAPACASPS